jgi:hypothetical protein
MQAYKNIDGDSGVIAYEGGSDFIRVKFKDGTIYVYTHTSAGAHNITQMKTLAANGEGLNAFININVRKKYARREQ